MPTTYDVFTAIIEHAPCKPKDLPFKKRIYAHLEKLVNEKRIKGVNGKYVPVKNKQNTHLFKIIKYCLKNGLDYNILLSKNIPKVITKLFESAPFLRPPTLAANKENTQLMKYLENHQFIFLVKNKPKKGIILKHQLLDELLAFYDQESLAKQIPFLRVTSEVLTIKTDPLNPFDDKIFSFLSGSAQLEGATITPGETKELILNDVYPEKPKKDIQMVKNLNEAMHYIFDNLEKDIEVEDIKQINRLVLFSLHRNAGKFKKTQNKIQGNPHFKTASPKQVAILLEEYCKQLKKIINKKACLEKLGYIHNELQRIHPFSDGNSRTTRMVVNWLLLKYHLPLLVLKMGCFDAYMNLTKLSQKRDDTKLMQFFHHALLHESLVD